ncbi:unnamed protein product [Lota lota]
MCAAAYPDGNTHRDRQTGKETRTGETVYGWLSRQKARPVRGRQGGQPGGFWDVTHVPGNRVGLIEVHGRSPVRERRRGRLSLDHVIHNPYARHMEEAEMDGDVEKTKHGGGSGLDLNLQGNLPQLGPHTEEEEEEVVAQTSDDRGDDITTSNRIPYQAKLVWRRFLSLWLRSRHRYNTTQTSAVFEHHQTPDQPAAGLWRYVTRKHLWLTARSGHRTLVACGQLSPPLAHGGAAQSELHAAVGERPTVVRSKGFLEEGELVVPLCSHNNNAFRGTFWNARTSRRNAPDACRVIPDRVSQEDGPAGKHKDTVNYQKPLNNTEDIGQEEEEEEEEEEEDQSLLVCPVLWFGLGRAQSSSTGAGSNAFWPLCRNTVPEMKHFYWEEDTRVDLKELLAHDDEEDEEW